MYRLSDGVSQNAKFYTTNGQHAAQTNQVESNKCNRIVEVESSLRGHPSNVLIDCSCFGC